MPLKHLIQQLILVPLRNGTFLSSLAGTPAYLRQFLRYQRRSHQKTEWRYLNPQLSDATSVTAFDPHYFHQSAWCAGKVAASKREKHVDIASQINMIAPLTGFVKVEFIDFRPLQVNIRNLTSRAGTILALPFPDRSVESLSCLHVIEHIGLGRYGDELDPEGSVKACKELQRILAVGGDLYFSTPVGQERVEFNAHRIHAPETILGYFNELVLVDFASVGDDGRFTEHDETANCSGLQYGLGMFHFRRERS